MYAATAILDAFNPSNPNAAQITGRDAISNYIAAGRARFTLVSKATGSRFTYKVTAPKDAAPGSCFYFVSVLTGADNEGSYTYAGILNARGFKTTPKSKISADAPSVKGFDWLIKSLMLNPANLGAVEFWHDGKCGRCGRALTVPESVASGIGPVCAGK